MYRTICSQSSARGRAWRQSEGMKSSPVDHQWNQLGKLGANMGRTTMKDNRQLKSLPFKIPASIIVILYCNSFCCNVIVVFNYQFRHI